MTTRHLMALDYADFQANSILKKHARNRALGDIEHRHNYVPAQPVLSCRTVQIDLPGTRTYRPKSTVDILDEQQRLIRHLYTKQRTTGSAPPRHRTDFARAAAPDIHGVNIEVKGRPLTSSSQINYRNDGDLRSSVTQRRPKTTGRLKSIQPATDCFMIVKVDHELLESTRNKRQATYQIHSYWKSENHNLAVGKFVRGQKRPDDVPPTLDAWLTFGGAAGEESEGLIDAFANFENSEEYYNIEGSVGSRVAKQLQKGDKIRIGINGVLQSRDLKVKKWNREPSFNKENEGINKEHEQKDLNQKDLYKKRESNTDMVEDMDSSETQKHPENDDLNENFKELMIDEYQEGLLTENCEEEKSMSLRKTPVPENEPVKRPEETVPLSWIDQCAKPDVKVINALVSVNKAKRQVMSETHPVKIEKLRSDELRPKFAMPKENGFKVKQRLSALKEKGNGRAVSSKVKVVYIDPLDKEKEEKVNSLSIEEIISDKFSHKPLENHIKPNQMSLSNDPTMITISAGSQDSPQSKKTLSSEHNQSYSRPSSNCSAVSERSTRIPGSKLKTLPTNSSHHPAMSGNLSITTPGGHNPTMNETPKTAKAVGRVYSSKPLNRVSPGTGSSMKVGPTQGETEYIKITSQLKISPSGTPFSPSGSQQASHNHYDYRPGSNTPHDGEHSPVGIDFSASTVGQPYNENDFMRRTTLYDQDLTSSHEISKNTNDENNMNYIEDHDVSSLSESPAPTTVAISIPTADELSDRDSVINSPSRPIAGTDDDLTSFQRRERNLRNEQIEQLTNLLGNAVLDS